jgi:hypothetical protein
MVAASGNNESPFHRRDFRIRSLARISSFADRGFLDWVGGFCCISWNGRVVRHPSVKFGEMGRLAFCAADGTPSTLGIGGIFALLFRNWSSCVWAKDWPVRA